MYLHRTQRRKNGKDHEYWSLVESRRLANGRVVQRHVLYLGEINGAQERSMRRRQLQWLFKRLRELQAMKLRREDLLMKLGAARQQAPGAWHLVEIEVDADRPTDVRLSAE